MNRWSGTYRSDAKGAARPNRTHSPPSSQPANKDMRTQQQRGPHTAASASSKQKQTTPPSKTSEGIVRRRSPSTTKDHAHAAPPEKLHGSNGGSESRISVTVSGWSTLSTNGRLLHHQVVSGDDMHGQTHVVRPHRARKDGMSTLRHEALQSARGSNGGLE